MGANVIEELALAGPILLPTLTGLILLFMDLLPGAKRSEGSWFLALVGSLLGLLLTAHFLDDGRQGRAFQGMLDVDRTSLVGALIVHASATFAILLSRLYVDRRPDIDQAEYYALLQFSVAGMAMLTAANDLVCVFLAIEILSVPLYVLTAMRLRSSRSIEAGAKYLLLGAFASAFLLFGMALWYGSSGTTMLSALAPEIARLGTGGGLAALGATLFLIGVLFKVAAAPFHAWTPDVYEGAPTPITAFMATATKAAVLIALLRAAPAIAESFGEAEATSLLAGIAVLTMFVGNLGALRQRNLKRLLAYSSIAHAGYMLVGVTVAVKAAGDPALADGAASVLYYVAVYAAMNLGAFAVALVIDRGGDREDVDDLRGLGRERPLLAAAMAVLVLALAGLPPTAGFLGKFYLFEAAVQADLVGLALAGVIASVVGLFYYLRILLVMYAEAPQEGVPAPRGDSLLAITSTLAVAVTLWLGLAPTWFVNFVSEAVRGY
jgi:NADH-quinone oxidoreductase subunit N